MTEKRFTHKKWYNNRQIFDGEEPFAIVDVYNQAEEICDKLNKLNDENEQSKMMIATLRNIILENEDLEEENEQLKQQLKDYHNAFDCSQCKYQNYNWFDGGDEFEVCDKGNNESQMDNHSCSEWEEL